MTFMIIMNVRYLNYHNYDNASIYIVLKLISKQYIIGYQYRRNSHLMLLQYNQNSKFQYRYNKMLAKFIKAYDRMDMT